jgi:DNA-binding transcriptional regulator YiaG
MDGNEIRAALAKLGLTQRQAGEVFRHGRRSIEHWACGERRPPQGIVILLHLLLEGKVRIEDVKAAAEKVATRSQA